MSTLRISNIEAKSVPASATIDEKVKITNSSGDTLVFLDGKTSGITTVGINTTDGNITFDANSNVVVTGIITATRFSGQITPTSLEIGSNIKLGNAGVITATSFVGALTGTASNASGATGDFSIADKIVHTGDTNTAIRFPSADTISIETAGVTRATVTGNNIDFPDAGTLRFGASNDLQIYHGTGGASNIIHSNTSQPLIINASGAGAIRLDTNSTERLRIDSSGQLTMSNAATTEFIAVNSTNNNTRGTISMQGKNSSGAVVTLRMGGFGDTGRGEIFTHSNHDLGFATNNAAAQWKMKTGGDLEIGDGNLVVASGHGINFSATANSSGSMSSELLDDYEEGSWTASMVGGNTMTTNGAYYTKIGRMVYWMLHCTPTFAQNNTSDYNIYGLPYISGNITQNYGWSANITYTQTGNNATLANMRPLVQMNDTYIYFHTVGLGDSSRIKNNFIRSTMLNQHFLLGGFYCTAT